MAAIRELAIVPMSGLRLPCQSIRSARLTMIPSGPRTEAMRQTCPNPPTLIGLRWLQGQITR